MLNKGGMTLVESLFAFNIYISVLIVFVSLFNILLNQETKIDNYYQELEKKEVQLSIQKDFSATIDLVLP